VTLDLPAVDDLFAAELEKGRSPGLVYAVVRDGEVLHARGLGTTTPGEQTPPTTGSVLRIASMTKSFTATAVLLLRDRGLLRLDDPVADHVSGAPAGLTVRHLLTMSGGLLTDDPWGDRNESQTPEELAELVADGITVGGPPGVTFEYSNLGYALLGRVIDAVLPPGTGGFRSFVLDEVTGPLGLAATTYDVRGVGPELVAGYHDHGDGWRPQPQVLPGTFSAMGGLHSRVTDLARWVGGFTDAFRRPDAPHPLSAASRREMQQQHRFAGVSGGLAVDVPAGGTALSASAVGYGFGLFVEHHSDHGHVVHHPGGYPGYGSHMRWHPETGLGVVALANGTYAAPVDTARDALRALVAGERAPVVAPVVTPALVDAVTDRITSPEPYAGDLFSFNVALDVPAAERLTQLAAARDLVGAPTGPATAPRSQGLGTATWSVPAERGRLDVEVKVAPTVPQPAVQSLKVTAVPDAPGPLRVAAEQALGGSVQGDGDDDATSSFARALGTARGLGGVPTVVGVLAGDGHSTATFAVRAGTTWWRLEISEGGSPALTACPTQDHASLRHLFGR
jgi:CubicO group peptidase (beta-lactamase class C family)